MVFVRTGSPQTRPEEPPRSKRAAIHPSIAGAALEPGAAAFLQGLCIASGIDPACYRESIFRRRQSACLRAVRARTTQAAHARIEADAGARERAFAALMIGVTAFFRDPHVFAGLQRVVHAVRRNDEPLRVLSVGCSDGSELYSAAMLLDELSLLESSVLQGVDCRRSAILAAERGQYAAASVEPLGERAAAYFRRVAGGYVVTEELRGRCSWRVADALGPLEAPATQDLVFCRNLAIYLTPDAARSLWNNLAQLLRPGGLLVVGKAERPGVRALVPAGPCLYRKMEATS